MDETQVKLVIEAALLAAGRPLPLETLASLFASKTSELDKDTLKRALEALAEDYRDRGLEVKEVASGYRIQIKSSMSDWLTPLWEERAPRYTRALLETLALIAYRQPITRAEIEEVRGVAVSTNIIRTLMERNWIRVVGHRDVPGKPAMFGTTKEFLDYFGLRKLEDLPALADIKDGFPESPQTDFLEAATATDGGDGLQGEAGLPEEAQQTGQAETAEADASDGDAAGSDDQATVSEGEVSEGEAAEGAEITAAAAASESRSVENADTDDGASEVGERDASEAGDDDAAGDDGADDDDDDGDAAGNDGAAATAAAAAAAAADDDEGDDTAGDDDGDDDDDDDEDEDEDAVEPAEQESIADAESDHVVSGADAEAGSAGPDAAPDASRPTASLDDSKDQDGDETLDRVEAG